MYFGIFIMKKLPDLTQKLINYILGGHGILNQYSWISGTPRNSLFCTENSYSTIAFVRHCKGPKHFGTECIRSNVYHTSPCMWKKDLWHRSIFLGSSFYREGRIFHRNKKVGQCIYTVDHINFCFKSIILYKLFS